MSKDKHIPQGYKDSPLGIIPKEWEVKRLGDIADITSGTTPLRSNSKYYNNGVIPWVKTTDLNNGTLYETEEKVSIEAVEKTSLKMLPKGTVLVAMYGGFRQIGRTALLGIDATINQALSALMCKSSVESSFVLAWLNCRVNYWKRLAASSRKDPNITGNEVAKFPILIPSKEEQGCIVEVLGLWDTAIEKQSELIEKLKLRKRALMQQLLTGKKRLTGFSGEWKEVKLGGIADVIGGGTPNTEVPDYWDGGIPWFTPTEIGKEKYVRYSKRTISDKGLNNSSARKLPIGTILFTSRATIGAKAILLTEATTNQGFQSLVVSSQISTEFVYYYLDIVLKEFKQKASGSTFQEISAESIRKIEVTIPCYEEQIAIATILVNADKEIEVANEKLSSIQSQKRGLMQQLLTGRKRLR